jgi:hypothetical protein
LRDSQYLARPHESLVEIRADVRAPESIDETRLHHHRERLSVRAAEHERAASGDEPLGTATRSQKTW